MQKKAKYFMNFFSFYHFFILKIFNGLVFPFQEINYGKYYNYTLINCYNIKIV